MKFPASLRRGRAGSAAGAGAAKTVRAGRVTAVAATVAALVAVVVPAAHANPPGKHDPFGRIGSVTALSTGGVQVTGWAADPDALTANATIVAVVDGRTSAYSTTTAYANAGATREFHTGPTPWFVLTVPLTTTRKHTVCVVARNVGAGLDTALRCVTTPLTKALSTAARARHNPHGAITNAWANAHSVHFFGWAADPDFAARPATVVLYVDGSARATATTKTYPASADSLHRYVQPRPSGAGGRSAFDILVSTPVGAHVGCVWAVNIGIGTGNTLLGCQTLDNRHPAGRGAFTTPTLNALVLGEANKHIGQPYVWGAIGPKAFDCSGLVQYSYHKFGYHTPRVSEDQFAVAWLIPASRVRPGDLVFYHDSVGDVYHVGIYSGPGMSVAAIDEQEGVNHQKIWAGYSSVSYGSFTHT